MAVPVKWRCQWGLIMEVSMEVGAGVSVEVQLEVEVEVECVAHKCVLLAYSPHT